MDRDLRPTLVPIASFVVALVLFFWMFTSGLDVLVLLGFVFGPLALFTVAFLWRFRVGHVAAPPEQVLASIGHAMRRSLYRVKEEPGELTIRIGSVSAVKVRARPAPGGTDVSYTVYATPTGWSLVIIMFLLWEIAIFSTPVVLFVFMQARAFARGQILPLAGPGGLPPSPTSYGDVRAILIDSLSEGYRVASEASEADRSTYHDLLLFTVFLAFVTWAIVFIGLFVSSAEADFGRRLQDANVVSLVAGVAVGVASGVLVRQLLRPRLLRLDAWAAQLREALAREVGGPPATEVPRSAFELLVEASRELPSWLSALRRGGMSREPGTWIAIIVAAFWGAGLLGAAVSFATFAPLVAIVLGLGGAGLIALAYLLVQGWRRRVDAERAEVVSSWDRRLAAIRAQMERFLQDL